MGNDTEIAQQAIAHFQAESDESRMQFIVQQAMRSGAWKVDEDGIRILCQQCGKLHHVQSPLLSQVEVFTLYMALHKHIDFCRCPSLPVRKDES